MKTALFVRFASVCSASAAAVIGHATLLDFRDIGDQGHVVGDVMLFGSTIRTQGFVLSGGRNGFVSQETSTGAGVARPLSIADDSAKISLLNGGTFDLSSMVIMPFWTGPSRPGVSAHTFTGVRADGSTVSQTFITVANSEPLHLDFASFNDLTSFEFEPGGTASFRFGDVGVSPRGLPSVPGPLAALPFALGFLRRRRRA